MQDTVSRAKDFIYRNARLLERKRYECLFEGGSKEAVLSALRAYRNPDGGFGNAIEADIRCPDSQPVGMQLALQVLDDLQAFDDPMVQEACEWLAASSTGEGGVPNALPTLNAYPHAPWWDTEPDPPADLNPTAAIAGLLLKNGVRHRWVDQASEYCWKAIESLDTTEYHTLMPVIIFLENAPDRPRAEKALERVREILSRPGVIELNPQAEGYVHKALEWAPTPGSWAHQLLPEDAIRRHIQAILDQQQEDGGWPISWPAQGPGAEAEWRGWLALETLEKLRAYGALGTR